MYLFFFWFRQRDASVYQPIIEVYAKVISVYTHNLPCLHLCDRLNNVVLGSISFLAGAFHIHNRNMCCGNTSVFKGIVCKRVFPIHSLNLSLLFLRAEDWLVYIFKYSHQRSIRAINDQIFTNIKSVHCSLVLWTYTHWVVNLMTTGWFSTKSQLKSEIALSSDSV